MLLYNRLIDTSDGRKRVSKGISMKDLMWAINYEVKDNYCCPLK